MTNKDEKMGHKMEEKLGMMVHACNLALGKLRQEDHCDFQASLNYIARTCLKKKKSKYSISRTISQDIK